MPAFARADRDLIVFHVAFAVIAALGLALPGLGATGLRVLALVVVYHLGFLGVAYWRGHAEWRRLWAFLLPLSALQVLPDRFLAEQLGVLVFPETGGPRLGAVPLYMAGMWTIPLVLIVWLGLRAPARWRWPATALASLAVFFAAEATLWAVPIWHAQHVATVLGVGVYLLVPEALLGPATLLAYTATRERPLAQRLAAAAAVMVFYLGSVALGYFLVDGGRG